MKKHILLFVALLAFMLSFFSCQKEEDPTKTPKVTDESIEVFATTATFSWTVDWLGKFASVVEVSENEDMSDSQTFGNETETDDPNYTVKVTGLKEATDYYYRFLIWNQNFVDKKFKTNVKSFTTKSGAPKVKTTEVTDVTRTTATVICEVTDESGSAVTERGVYWGITPNPTTNGSHITSGNGLGAYSVALSDLEVGKTYYVLAYAINENGTAYGEELCFTTLPGLPVVRTTSVFSGIYNNAVGRGEVISDGGCEVTECGVYYGISPNPVVTGEKLVVSLLGDGSFSFIMTNLDAETVYYVCAYATNAQGTSYGSELSFSTSPEGTSSGIFSVSSSKRVYFSQGNLQYQASTNTWRFSNHQYDVIGNDNSNISSSYSGWIDMFGWGTSGWNSGAVCYQPWSTSTSFEDYYPGGTYTNDLAGNYANADWGVYNAVSNGGNQAGLWRTLTMSEWVYVFNIRSTVSGIRYAKACVNGMNGMILLPDNWNGSYYPLSGTNSTGANYSSNTISASEWIALEQHGAVFLPAAGDRAGNSVYNVGSIGYYWTASYANSGCAYGVDFVSSFFDPQNGTALRQDGRSVRLVRNAQ